MNSDEFGAYRNRIDQVNPSIHINIEDNSQSSANNEMDDRFSTNRNQAFQSNEITSNRFHTMLNRVVRNTNAHRNHRFMFNNISPTAIARSLISNSNNEDRRHEHNTFNTNQHGAVPNIEIHSNQSNNGHLNVNELPINVNEPTNHAPLEEDNNNVFSDILVRLLGNFVRYLPFLVILFVKFLHDHLVGILDLAILQIVIWFINKSLSNQVAKFSQKKIFILLRDFVFVAITVTYRLLLTSAAPDPFGLIINPPPETITIEISSTTPSGDQSSAINQLSKYLNSPNLRATIDSDTGNAIHVTRAISLGLLIYYVAVNDLLLKLLTIWTKIIITMLPAKLLRHNQRARLYVLIEYFSQFYRSLAPIRQWVLFLFKSYTGLEVISGILFSAFYLGAKGFEFVSRGKVLQKAFLNFIRNMDYERKPTKVELNAAGEICPICHDSFKTPVILTCNHIFCDDCVGQWFKREQTCPMCRAKVSEDPQWMDGTTSFFYQLC